MSFEMPKYHHPDFTKEQFVNAPDVQYKEAETDGVAPDDYHSTSMYPEYFKIDGEWRLAEESRMDSCVILCDDGHLAVVEARNIKKGDKVNIFAPAIDDYSLTIEKVKDEKGNIIDVASHPKQIVRIPCEKKIPINAIMRVNFLD